MSLLHAGERSNLRAAGVEVECKGGVRKKGGLWTYGTHWRSNLRATFLILLFAGVSEAAPKQRRVGFVASTNGGHETFAPIAATLIEHASSWTVAHAYCSSPGLVTNATVLPDPPFCWDNWTLPIRAAAPHIDHVPIIQLLGDSGPENFVHPFIFAAKYVSWAQAFNFSGFLLDAEFKGDDAAFAAFLNVFADALHAVGKTLGVFLYPDLGKKDLVNATRADYWCVSRWGAAWWHRAAVPLVACFDCKHAMLVARSHPHEPPAGWVRGLTSAAQSPPSLTRATPSGAAAG